MRQIPLHRPSLGPVCALAAVYAVAALLLAAPAHGDDAAPASSGASAALAHQDASRDIDRPGAARPRRAAPT
jgi:hypothetical protein